MQRSKDLTSGQRFGRLAVVRRDGYLHGSAAWLCLCDCGLHTLARFSSLTRGEIVSCGCKKKEVLNRKTHGMRRTPEWKAWDSAIQRTTNPNHKSYADYGGRGIRVCTRWSSSFEAFYEDMGPRPIGHSLDRYPDQNGNYEPSNCRWATWTEQANNKRNNKLVTIEGRTMTVPEWAREAGIRPGCLAQRLESGLTGPELLSPSNKGRKFLSPQGWSNVPQ